MNTLWNRYINISKFYSLGYYTKIEFTNIQKRFFSTAMATSIVLDKINRNQLFARR